MPGPCQYRNIRCSPNVNYFKQRGIPMDLLEEANLTLDARLADFDRLYQEKAAGKMNVSRHTFGNIIKSAHKKIAEALFQGKALKIEGGLVKRLKK